jgi:hypothetical protein
MTVRIVTRVTLFMAGLGLAVALVLVAMGRLASAAEGTAVLGTDHVAAVERGVSAVERDRPAGEGAGTPPAALVFAGIVVLAALPSAHRIHVYHRSDWRYGPGRPIWSDRW